MKLLGQWQKDFGEAFRCGGQTLLKSTSGCEVLDYALSVLRNWSPEQALKNNQLATRAFELNGTQRANLEILKARIGLTRKVEFVQESRENQVGFVGNRLHPKAPAITCYGSHWPECYPAYIAIQTPEALSCLESPELQSSYTTTVLRELVHIKCRRARIQGRQLLWGTCALVTAITAGYFVGGKLRPIMGHRKGGILGLAISYWGGSWLSNLIVEYLHFEISLKTNEKAAKVSTFGELRAHLRMHLNTFKKTSKNWRQIFSCHWQWLQPQIVIARKLAEICEQKPNHERVSSLVLAHRMAKSTNALDENGELLCPIQCEPIPKSMRAIFVYFDSQGMPLSTIYHRDAIFTWLKTSPKDPQTRAIIQILFDHEGTVIHPIGQDGEVVSLAELIAKRRSFIPSSGREGISRQELEERNKHRQMIDEMFLEKFGSGF